MAIRNSVRFEVFKRDNFTCQYCGRSAPEAKLQADHVIPQSKGGSDKPYNLITSCFKCNNGKWDKLLPEGALVFERIKTLKGVYYIRSYLAKRFDIESNNEHWGFSVELMESYIEEELSMDRSVESTMRFLMDLAMESDSLCRFLLSIYDSILLCYASKEYARLNIRSVWGPVDLSGELRPFPLSPILRLVRAKLLGIEYADPR